MKLPGLAKYGTTEIILNGLLAASLIALAFLLHVPWLAIIPAVLYGWVLWFFRNPVRTPPDNPRAVLSPADGVITHIEERECPEFVGERCIMVGIFLSVFDVHINRAPFKGTVQYTQYRPGAFHDARTAESSTENENNAIGIETDHPDAPRMLVKQIAGLLARRIVCDCAPGDACAAGDILGMIKFGSRTELYLPTRAGFASAVKVGDKVRAGTTVLGEVK